MKKILLAPDQFDALVVKTRLKAKGIELARAALVDGKGYTEVANEHGLHRRDVYQAAQIIMRQLTPDDAPATEVHTYSGPAEMFEKIEAIIAAYNGQRLA
jgi:hypothetical protein